MPDEELDFVPDKEPHFVPDEEPDVGLTGNNGGSARGSIII